MYYNPLLRFEDLPNDLAGDARPVRPRAPILADRGGEQRGRPYPRRRNPLMAKPMMRDKPMPEMPGPTAKPMFREKPRADLPGPMQPGGPKPGGSPPFVPTGGPADDRAFASPALRRNPMR